jgi:undecaprenyl-diphosphatase
LALAAIAAVLALALVAWAVFGHAGLAAWDRDMAAAIQAHAPPTLTALLRLVSDGHRPRFILGMTAAVGLVLLWRRDRSGLLMLLATVGGGAALNHLLKHNFARPRPGPDSAWAAVTDFSFPSGHVANSTLLYGAVAALVLLGSRSNVVRIAAVAGAVSMVLLVSASRLVLGAHYPSDVLAGALVGAGWLMLCVIGLQYGRDRHRPA